MFIQKLLVALAFVFFGTQPIFSQEMQKFSAMFAMPARPRVIESFRIEGWYKNGLIQFDPIFPSKDSGIGLTLAKFSGQDGLVPIVTGVNPWLRQGRMAEIRLMTAGLNMKQLSEPQVYRIAVAERIQKPEMQQFKHDSLPAVTIQPLQSHLFAAKLIKMPVRFDLNGEDLREVVIRVGERYISVFLDNAKLPGVFSGSNVEVEVSQWVVSSTDEHSLFFNQSYVTGIAWVKGLTLAPLSQEAPWIPAGEGVYAYPSGETAVARK